jgi:PAS domain S-box-containing protein
MSAQVQAVHPSLNSAPSARVDRLQRRSFLWLAIGFGMLLAITLILSWMLHQVNVSDRWVEHTREVISANQRLLADVKDAESGERGYIITGDEGYLVPYNSALGDVPQSLSNLQQLTADNPKQQQRVRDLAALITRRLSVFQDALLEEKESGPLAAQRVVLAGRGRDVMKQIRDLSQQIEAEEYGLLAQRQKARQANARNGFFAVIGAVLLAVLTLIAASIDVRGAIRQRNLARQEQHEDELRVRALFETAAQAILIIDRAGRIVQANPSTQRIFDYSPNELIGQSIEILIPERMRGVHIRHRENYFVQPQNRPMGVGLDLQARRKDGSEFFVEISLSYIQTVQGTLGVAFVTDIAKRKADETAIRQQREELRLLAGRLMTAQDDERRRIARDLHDDLSQKLAYLAMDMAKLATAPRVQGVVDLRSLQMRAADAAESVRRISHQLHPSILDDIGLEAALEQYCEEFQERSGIATHFSSSNVPEALAQEVANSIYHIAAECLRNVSKHSNTEEVFVRLEVVDHILRLSVRDEGVGLSPNRLRALGAGIGIVGMKERAHLVNGKLSLQSQSGEGTEVSVEVPL